MKRFLGIAVIGLIFLSNTCKKEMELPDPELKKIFGKWEWVESSGGFAGKITTPLKAGYNMRIEFGKEGTCQKFKNDSLIAKKPFSFSQKESIQTHKPAWVISLDESSIPMAVSFSGNDTLMLNEQVHDGYQNVYTRIK